MKALTRLQSVEEKGQSVVITMLGDKVAGTQDRELGQKLMDIFQRDPENCLVSLEIDKRPDGKLWVTGVDFEAPPELGGPADEEFEGGVKAETVLRADLPTPIITLDQLIRVEDRLTKVEDFLELKGFER